MMNGFEVVDSWLTPTVLFCILNLTIVTIFLLKPHEKLKKQLTPDRIRPFLFETINSIPDNQETTYNHKLVQPVQSLLELVKPIIKVSLFASKPQPEPVQEKIVHVVKTRSDIVPRVMKTNLITSYYHEKSVSVSNPNKVLNKSVSDTSPPVKNYLPQFVRVKSLVNLLEPIKLTLFGSEQQPEPVHQNKPVPRHEEPVHAVHARDTEKKSHVRSRSDMSRVKHVKKVLRKSFSEVSVAETVEVVEKRRPETVREKKKSLGDEAVDAKADDFIIRFRKQLKLQRMAPHFEMHGNVEQRDWEVRGGVELLG